MNMLQGWLRTATLGHRGTLQWTARITPLAVAAAVTTAIAGTSARTHAVAGPRYYVDLGPVVAGAGGGPFKEATVVHTATGKAAAIVDSPEPPTWGSISSRLLATAARSFSRPSSGSVPSAASV